MASCVRITTCHAFIQRRFHSSVSDIVMSDIHALVNTEKIGRTGVITSTGCRYSMRDKVSSILNRMWGDGSRPNGWKTYRLAYGVQKLTGKPTRLKRVDLSPPYDPTMEELFNNISLKEGDRYYLVISILDVNNRYDKNYKKDVKGVVYWLQELYMHLHLPDSTRPDVDWTQPTVENSTTRNTSPRSRDSSRERATSSVDSPPHNSTRQRDRNLEHPRDRKYVHISDNVMHPGAKSMTRMVADSLQVFIKQSNPFEATSAG